MGNFKFGEHSTKDFDLVIQAPPTYNFPEKDVTIEHIPGRNGDLIIDNNCWKNTERTYSVASIFRPGTDFIANSERLIKWLTSTKGYHRLEDSYDPNVYRMAQYRSSGSLTNYYDQATALNITFECKPQRYLKNGEIAVDFNGHVAVLENPTGYPALPELTIQGINPSDNEVMLITVRNLKENKVTSVITLNKVLSDDPYDIILNSELQTVYSLQLGDVNAYVNLNEKEFPVLYSDFTEISIDKYSENSSSIESYNAIIDRTTVGNNNCFAKYRPFDSVVESKQKQIYIMSFDLLKQKAQEVYEMKAYANYCMDKAESYTFTSFNTILGNRCASFSFQGDYSAFPDWLLIDEVEGQIRIRVGQLPNVYGDNRNYGYFMTTNANSDSDKKMVRLQSGEVISNSCKATSTVTINFYPADVNGNLGIDYSEEDIPDWLDFEIEYEDDNLHAPKVIKFIHKENGYYYLPKSGLFGKAQWVRYSSRGELNSLTWSTSKKAFMPSGLTTSTTASFQYFYLSEAPQYEDVMENVLDENGQVKKDANGNPIQKVANKVHFRVIPLSDDLTSIKIMAADDGYYRMNDDLQSNGWNYHSSSDSTPIAGNIKSTSSNLIYYLENSPTYDIVDGWPEWLDPNPIKRDANNNLTDSINPKYVDFRVLQNGWYKYTYETDNGTNNTCWVYRDAGYPLGIIDPNTDIIYPADSQGYLVKRTNEDSCTVYMLEGVSSEFPVKKYVYTDSDDNSIDNIAILYKDNNGEEHEYPNNQPPSWLKIEVNVGIEEDGSDTVLDFYPLQNGLYKWDQKTVWETKQSSTTEAFVTSKPIDDTSIYFMSSLPEYPTSGEIYEYCSVEVNTNKTSGNPESITISAKISGYYRFKNSSSWKYYNVGDEICESKINESTDIYYLTESQESLDNISMSIIPKWWRL